MRTALTSERALRDRVAELEEEVRQLKDAFAPRVGFPKGWKLNERETAILSALHASRASYVTVEALLLRIAGFDTDQDDSDVRVWVGSLRRKVEPHGIRIRTRHDEGYVLAPESRPVIAEALGEVPITAAPTAGPTLFVRNAWSEAEDAIMGDGYARALTLTSIGIALVTAGYRRRSIGTISQRGQFLGLTADRASRTWSREEDDLLRDAHSAGVSIADIRGRLAQAGFRRSFGAIQMRAIHLGISGDRVRRWSARELEIATRGLAAGKRHRAILDELRAAGFDRGTTSLSKLAQLHNLTRAHDPWSEAELALLRDRYAAKAPVKEIAAALGKSVSAVATRASQMGLKQRVAWTDEERRLLIDASEQGGRLVDVAKAIGRPYPNVAAEASRLGLDFRARRHLAMAAE